MDDMRSVIIARSDQTNADDLLAGPTTIKITAVEIRPGTEQPVTVRFDGDKGKPFKPCKSMCRVMVNCWGADSNQYIGRSMTLYCDPKVKWGGMAVGGIRISHMSDIDRDITMALTETKQSRKPFTVKPLHVALGPSRGALEADAMAHAQKGVEAFRLYYKNLPAEDRAYLKPTIGVYQTAANQADAARAGDPADGQAQGGES